jgi:hypothetical protein
MQNEPASDAAVEGLERAKLLDSESDRLNDELSEGACSDAARRDRISIPYDEMNANEEQEQRTSKPKQWIGDGSKLRVALDRAEIMLLLEDESHNRSRELTSVIALCEGVGTARCQPPCY